MAYGMEDGAVPGGADSSTRLIAYAAAPHFLPISIPTAHPGLDRRWPPSAFPELDCVRDRLPSHVVAAVEHRAAEIGVGAERVLIASGFMDEDHYVYALARSLGLEYETFDGRERACCSLPDQRLLLAAEVGLLPLIIDGEEVFVLAPRSARHFIDLVARYPKARFRLTSSA